MIRDLVQFIFSSALFINALLFVPQVMTIVRRKTSEGVSMATFIGFFLIQLSIIMHGLLTHDGLLVLGYSLSLLSCGAVIASAFIYRKNSFPDSAAISLSQVIKQLPGHIYWKDKEGVALGCNDNNWKKTKCLSLDEWVGSSVYDTFTKEEADKLRLVDEEVMRTGKTREVVEEICIDGEPQSYLSVKSPLFNESNEVVGFIGTSLNITRAKKKMDERLEMQESIIAAMPGNVYWLDKQGEYLGCNDNQARSAGLSSRKDIVGKFNLDIPGFVIPDVVDKVNQEVISTGKMVVAEEPVVRKDGSDGIYLSSKVPLRDHHGTVSGLLGISIDITQRKQIEQELKETKEQAETANKAKQEFLYNMRHDIRTPFSGIVSVSQILKKDESDPNKIELLDAIEDSSERILDYLNEILEFTQIEEGSIPVVEKPLSLKTVIENCLAMIKPTALQKTLALNLDYDEGLDEIYLSDEFRLRRVLVNLLGNSIKFTESGSISVYVSLKGKRDETREVLVELQVKDTGVGIPKEKQNLIFDKFSRLTPSYEGEFKGTGLGLRAVKRMVNDLDGDIWLESDVGEGALFTIQLPMKCLKLAEFA
jgi:two-component system aerobic respiration control sensor histidine kinase ArcB